MSPYIGTKILNAKPMTRQAYNDLRGWTVPNDENPADEGYLVEYHDGGQANHPDFQGYISWSPKEVFERSYRPTAGMTFGMAIEAMNAGQKVARDDWNGKGLRLALVGKGGCFEHEIGTLPYIVMLCPQDAANTAGAVVPWLASQTDMLAEDWVIVE